MVRGYAGYEDFAGIRRFAVDQVIDRCKYSRQETPLSRGSFFHDGQDLLPAVVDWHQLLRKSLRIGDQITNRVLDLVEKKMLISNPDKRISAKKLVQELNVLVEQDVSPSPDIPPCIQHYFDQLKNEVSEKVQKSDTTEGTPIKALSNSNKQLDIENHRLSYLTTTSRPAGPHPFGIAQTLLPADITPSHVAAHAMSGDPFGPTSPSQQITADLKYPRIHNEVSSQHGPWTPGYMYPVASPETTLQIRPKKRSAARPENAWQVRERLRKEKDAGIFPFFHSESRDNRLTSHYKNRDIIFLIDNQESMFEFWGEARWIFDTLLMISRNIDENGIDLSFTCSKVEKPHEKKVNALLGAFDDPEVAPKPGTTSNMVHILENVFEDYLARIDQEKEKAKSNRRNSAFWHKKAEKDAEVKNASLIVLTDGVWPNCKKDDFRRIFGSFTRGIIDRGRVINSRTRSYSVQFVRFGANPEAIDLLSFLDDDLESHLNW
jgi:hypothetical protein